MLKDLISLANCLDERMLLKEADCLDGVIRKYLFNKTAQTTPGAAAAAEDMAPSAFEAPYRYYSGEYGNFDPMGGMSSAISDMDVSLQGGRDLLKGVEKTLLPYGGHSALQDMEGTTPGGFDLDVSKDGLSHMMKGYANELDQLDVSTEGLKQIGEGLIDAVVPD